MRDFIHKWLRIPHILHVGVDTSQQNPETTIVFIHGIANSQMMWTDIIARLDKQNIRIITVDLLGFGASPKPAWQTYSATTHARSLHMTLLKRRIKSPVILVGHSLGALIAIQYAKKYKSSVKSLLLCSPPFYKPSKLAKEARVGHLAQKDDAYHLLYRNSRYRHHLARRLALFMKSARLLSRHFTVTDETLPAIVSSLEMSIENQTSLEDAESLSVPLHILYGKFDPLIIKTHIHELQAANNQISVTVLPVGHEIMGKIYRQAIVSKINDSIHQLDKQ